MKSAKKLPNVERFRGKSDPLAILTFQGESVKVNSTILILINRLKPCCWSDTLNTIHPALNECNR